MLDPLLRRFIAWRDRHIAIKSLQSFDDRMLDDVGTCRDRIIAFVDNQNPCQEPS